MVMVTVVKSKGKAVPMRKYHGMKAERRGGDKAPRILNLDSK
jgi:hypothetical protein